MIRLDTKSGRAKLDVRPAPYFVKVSKGRFLGYRKLPSGATWTARARAEDGRQVHRVLGEDSDAFGHDEAAAAARAWFAELDRGVSGRGRDGEHPTVETACREYVDDRRSQKGDATADAAARFFERRVYGLPPKPAEDGTPAKPGQAWRYKPDPIAAVRLDRFRPRHLVEWRDRLVAAGLSRSSVNREMTTLRAALNLAVRHKLVSRDASDNWRDVKPFAKADNRRELYLDRAQRRALIENATGAVRDLIEAAALTGARAGELTSATCSSFDARTKRLSVTGKTGARVMTLAPRAVELFQRRAEGRPADAYLLTRDDGEPWSHSDWDDLVRAAAKAAKLPDGVVLYTLRHSWITEALLGGLSTLEVSKFSGTSLRMIEKHYGHLVAASSERLAALEFV